MSNAAWKGYLNNSGLWLGRRALCNARGKVLVDLPSRVEALHFRDPSGDEFLKWTTAIRTEAGLDYAEEEWSRSELADLGALVADGSFSKGPDVFVGEPATVDSCICEGELRVRSTHAFDWEGRLTGIVASREHLQQRTEEEGKRPAPSFIEPAAWRSPTVFFDYLLGTWQGRGVLLDTRNGTTERVTSRLKLAQNANGEILQRSRVSVVDGGPERIVEAAARLDRNLLIFPDINVQVTLLPGGIYVSSPIRIRRGSSFVVELAFLMRPDCRKRVIRCYSKECEWVNTIFVSERRVR